MALFGKVGSLIRQTNGPASMLNTVRFMSSKLFVGGLSYGTDDQSLRDAFSSFGDVEEARVISDRDTGRSRGFGFVSFTDPEAANSAMSAMDGQELQGRNIRVNLANERPPRNNFGGGGGYGGNSDGYRRGYGDGGSNDAY